MKGYTLVEVLVVVAILGVLLTVTTLGMRGDATRPLQAEAERLARNLELAQARTRLNAWRIAFTVAENSYTFWRRGESGNWQAFDGDSDLKARTLPQGMRIAVRGANVAATPDGTPYRMVFSAEDPTPFALELTAAGTRAVVENSIVVGQVTVTTTAAQAHE